MMLPSNYDYIDTLVERYNEEKTEALNVHEYKSNQYYPTPENIVNDIVYYVSDKKILEPSAGRGNIANRFEDIHCIDKEELNTNYS